MNIHRPILITLLPLSLILSSCSNGNSEPSAVKSRTDTMKNWRDAIGVMNNMVEKPDTFDLNVFQEQASYLAEDANTPWTHFEDATALGKATENVWNDPEGFQAEIDKYQQATSQLNTVAANASTSADIESALSDVRASCKSCHEDYKINDDK